MKYDVIIIGAGPGGIFSAYEMVQRSKDVKIAVFEAGHALDKRHCPIDGVKVKNCVNCRKLLNHERLWRSRCFLRWKI